MLLSAVAACGGGDSSGGITAPPVPVTLSFTLQQVNGQGLPATFQASEGIIVITSGTMQLRPDKSFAENIVYNFTPTGGSMESDAAIVSGTYTQTGSDIVFTIPPEGADPGSTFSGTVLDNTLSYNDAGFVAVYSR